MRIKDLILKSKGKSGSAILDLILIIIILFILAITFFISYKVLYEVDANTASTIQSSTVAQLAFDKGIEVMQLWNYMFIFILAGLTVLVMVSAFFLRTHPIFFFASIFLLLIVILIAVIFSNAFEAFYTQSAFDDIEADYSAIIWVFNHLPLVTLIISTLALIIYFSKSKYDFSGGGSL